MSGPVKPQSITYRGKCGSRGLQVHVAPLSQPPSPTLPRAGLILPAPWGVTSMQDSVGGKDIRTSKWKESWLGTVVPLPTWAGS